MHPELGSGIFQVVLGQKMKGFEQLWNSVARTRSGEAVSAELKPLLRGVHDEVTTAPVNLPALKNCLVELLRYLSLEGRTNANCWAADLPPGPPLPKLPYCRHRFRILSMSA
jgi:hypothetical protein